MFGTPGISLSPAWFRRLILPAYHENWDQAERELLADPVQRRRIAELESELYGAGLERPVVLGREHWWSPRVCVVDGVHRSIAAMRLGQPIPVRYGYDRTAVWDHSDLYRIAPDAPLPDDTELIDAVMELSSFRCSAGPWIQCDVASGVTGGPVTVRFPHHPELRARITEDFEARLRSAGVAASVEFVGQDSF